MSKHHTVMKMVAIVVSLVINHRCVLDDRSVAKKSDDTGSMPDTVVRHPTPFIIDTVELSSPLRIRQLSTDSTVVLRYYLRGIIAYSESGDALDTFSLSSVSGIDSMGQMSDRLAIITVNLKGASSRQSTHVVGFDSGAFRPALGLRTLESVLSHPESHINYSRHYSIRIYPSSDSKTLRLNETYKLQSEDKHDAWVRQTILRWDSLRMIYRNDLVDVNNVLMENPVKFNDSLYISGKLPSVDLREYMYVCVQNHWYGYSPVLNRLYSMQWE